MGLLDFFRPCKPKTDQPSLVGLWLGDNIEIDIRPDGTMDYVIIAPGKRQIMKLTYRIEGNEIVSNQPSAPKEERTKFWFENTYLVLMFAGERSEFRRASR
jgi:hypothetical protein